MHIAIMGGTFDPPHLGHTVPVEVAAAEFSLDTVWFVPNAIPPHKKREGLTDGYHRSSMVALALRPFEHFRMSPMELLRNSVSYTVDTVEEFRRSLAQRDRLFFVMGTDSFLELETWHDYSRLIRLCELVIISRGTNEEELEQHLARLENVLQLDLRSSVHFAHTPSLPISSSAIRSAIAQGRDVSPLLNPDVQAYINKHLLYRR
jgi:nicotinate-nucleotide adenylyltransferase